ncbi:uridine kinase family-domain-containing protein [Leucosporidium creatinivorum]|uniref:uridine/cytidine kinase n=1 Tax=Leucosporidium creatinivorum TaxID=106004 RepID=A0A1Y2ET78_9BASI|nr:uridine kinase family-domain-containing protein [Leucosporidium creatinivorum]
MKRRPSPPSSARPRQPSLPKNTILTEAGRSPWYSKDGQTNGAYCIGIAGGSASGKTRVATEILKSLGVPWVLVISQDNFYNSLSPDQSAAAFRNEHDFDSPQSFDYDKLRQVIVDLKACKSVQIPNYSFVLHQRTEETTYLYGAAVIIIEGLFVLHDKAIRDVLDLKVFVQCDSDLMLARRLRRDLVERGRDAAGVLDQYLRFVKPSFDDHIQPTSRYADILVPGQANEKSIDLITGHIRRQLDERKLELRGELFSDTQGEENGGRNGEVRLPETVTLLKEGSQLKGIHTILRSHSTLREEFRFFADRLSTLVIETALSLLPSRPKPITTRTGISHIGQELDILPNHLCGVSILRSGASLEKGLRRVLRDCPIGSVLIQSDRDSGEPLLYEASLPGCITASAESASKSFVLLLDAQIGTGAAALMAVRVLLDHGVPEENVLLCTILVSKVGGVWALRRAFPRVRIVSSAADDGLEERTEETRAGPKKVFAITPGFGCSFGDRYFGAP